MYTSVSYTSDSPTMEMVDTSILAIKQAVSRLPSLHAERTTKHLQRCVVQFDNLLPNVSKYVFDNGDECEMICLKGTIPTIYKGMGYKGEQYNTPISIWLYEDYPLHAPIVMVTPTRDMLIKPSKIVDNNGRVNIPYLGEWNPTADYDLFSLVNILCMEFSTCPPLSSRARNSAGPILLRPVVDTATQETVLAKSTHIQGRQRSYPPGPGGYTGGYSEIPWNTRPIAEEEQTQQQTTIRTIQQQNVSVGFCMEMVELTQLSARIGTAHEHARDVEDELHRIQVQLQDLFKILKENVTSKDPTSYHPQPNLIPTPPDSSPSVENEGEREEDEDRRFSGHTDRVVRADSDDDAAGPQKIDSLVLAKQQKAKQEQSKQTILEKFPYLRKFQPQNITENTEDDSEEDSYKTPSTSHSDILSSVDSNNPGSGELAHLEDLFPGEVSPEPSPPHRQPIGTPLGTPASASRTPASASRTPASASRTPGSASSTPGSASRTPEPALRSPEPARKLAFGTPELASRTPQPAPRPAVVAPGPAIVAPGPPSEDESYPSEPFTIVNPHRGVVETDHTIQLAYYPEAPLKRTVSEYPRHVSSPVDVGPQYHTLPPPSNHCPICGILFREEHDLSYRSFHVNNHLD